MQLQSEVRKCLNNWLKQGIICPSKSPYASQVVIVRKKTGKICLCVDFRRLNAISIRDSFPLPHVEEALQAVQATVWFSSFDLAQGYLQMAMEEEDILKTAFHAGSSGLYEFTCMPFGLTNAGTSFCRLKCMVSLSLFAGPEPILRRYSLRSHASLSSQPLDRAVQYLRRLSQDPPTISFSQAASRI